LKSQLTPDDDCPLVRSGNCFAIASRRQRRIDNYGTDLLRHALAPLSLGEAELANKTTSSGLYGFFPFPRTSIVQKQTFLTGVGLPAAVTIRMEEGQGIFPQQSRARAKPSHLRSWTSKSSAHANGVERRSILCRRPRQQRHSGHGSKTFPRGRSPVARDGRAAISAHHLWHGGGVCCAEFLRVWADLRMSHPTPTSAQPEAAAQRKRACRTRVILHQVHFRAGTTTKSRTFSVSQLATGQPWNPRASEGSARIRSNRSPTSSRIS